MAFPLLLAGCVTFVEPSGALGEARTVYQEAAADPQVHVRAAAELSLAERALAQAERSWRDKAPDELVQHQAYLASQQSRVALATARYRTAEAKTATAREQRSRLLLEVREREAAEAKSRAEAAGLAEAAAQREAEEARRALAEESQKGPDLAAELKRLQAQVAGLKTQQTERGWTITLRNELLFNGGASTLKPGAAPALDNLGRFLRDNPDRDIAIEGFTDSVGSSATNRQLSETRAQAVKEALIGRGIEARRIDARGYGPSFPVATNETPTGRQANRRVEIVINPS
jgi:outer membrane protein OmpA-like peptidoglycan-associated protein